MDQVKSVCWVYIELNQSIFPAKGNLDERIKIGGGVKGGKWERGRKQWRHVQLTGSL